MCLSNKWKIPQQKKENYFSSLLQTKPSMSVIVQKIQFRICLRGTFSHLFRKKCGFYLVICDVWQWLKQQFIWLMHLQMHAATHCRKSLNTKGHKCIQKLLGRSFVFKLSNSSPAHGRILMLVTAMEVLPEKLIFMLCKQVD